MTPEQTNLLYTVVVCIVIIGASVLVGVRLWLSGKVKKPNDKRKRKRTGI